MHIDKSKTVAFTGYRTAKILRSSNDPRIIETITAELEKTIVNLHNKGYDTFCQGMSEGFDLLAAEAVLRIKMKHPAIRLVAVIPFKGQELQYSERDKERYKIIYELANKVIFTSDTYHDKAFFMRNDFLLDSSSMLVCYYDGQRGGTMYTVNRAILTKMPIINIFTFDENKLNIRTLDVHS